jgi:hypothetical protein
MLQTEVGRSVVPTSGESRAGCGTFSWEEQFSGRLMVWQHRCSSATFHHRWKWKGVIYCWWRAFWGCINLPQLRRWHNSFSSYEPYWHFIPWDWITQYYPEVIEVIKLIYHLINGYSFQTTFHIKVKGYECLLEELFALRISMFFSHHCPATVKMHRIHGHRWLLVAYKHVHFRPLYFHKDRQLRCTGTMYTLPNCSE